MEPLRLYNFSALFVCVSLICWAGVWKAFGRFISASIFWINFLRNIAFSDGRSKGFFLSIALISVLRSLLYFVGIAGYEPLSIRNIRFFKQPIIIRTIRYLGGRVALEFITKWNLQKHVWLPWSLDPYHNTWEHVFENEKYARVETPKICKYRLSLNEKCKNLKILGSEIEIMIFQSFP